MKKKIEISLIPNTDKTFNVTFIKDEEIVKEKQLDQESIKLYMQEHLDEKELEHARKLVKLFKCNKLTFDLKE